MERFALTAAGILSLILSAVAVEAVNAQTSLDSPNLLDRPSPSLNRPTGRLYPDGRIETPTNSMRPSVTVPYSNGRTTYYYPDGTSITVEQEDVDSYGTVVRPGEYNGGLRNDWDDDF